MAKGNGNGARRNGNGQHLPGPPAVVTLTEALALSIAHGAAASAFDIVTSHAAGDRDALPAGQFWYAGGAALPGHGQAERMQAIAAFVLAYPDAPGEALYRHVCMEITKRSRGPWAELPLAERQAFVVFGSTLVPLITEVRADARRRQTHAAPAPPPPNRGIFKRTGTRRPGGINRKIVLSHTGRQS